MKNTILDTLSKLVSRNICLDEEIEDIKALIKNMVP